MRVVYAECMNDHYSFHLKEIRQRVFKICLFLVSLYFIVLVVVGYTGAKKGSCFKFLRVPAFLMQYDLLSILTPFFIEIGQKMRRCPPKKLNRMRGVLWGVLKRAIWTKYLILHHTVFILVLSCIFLWSKNPFVKVLRKSDHPYS